MKYIDIKVTVWNRLKFADDTDMQELVDTIKNEGVEAVIDDSRGFLESETLYDTEDEITPAENDGASTVEVYQNRELLWQNGNPL